MMTINNTLMFVSKRWFMYGQGDDIVGCFADAIDSVVDVPSFARQYPKCFDTNDEVGINKIVDTEEYCVCYDDANDFGQKSFSGSGSEIKDKLLNLYHKEKVDAVWIYPMTKAIKTKELENEIRNNPKSYAKVADWIGEEQW